MNGLLTGSGLVSSLGLVAAVLMIRVGMTQRALQQRHGARPCASCGRSFSGRRCPRCARL
jgi:hypothetical protein